MNSVTTLYDFAEELLAESVLALTTTTAGSPTRAYVAASLPALDCCPQLTVHVQGLALEGTSPVSPGPVVGFRTQLGQVNLATLLVTIVRCSPQPTGGDLTPPDAAANATFAATVLEDLWALWNWITNIIRDGTLFEGKCMGVYLDGATPIDDQGGCGGWTFTIRTSIQGYASGS